MTISAARLADSLSQLQQLFGKSDKNKNASLSQAEFAEAAANSGLSSATGTNVTTLFHQMDTNGNGEISKDELSRGIKLAENVEKALLMAQEMMSGKTLLTMLGNNGKPSDAATSMFSDASGQSSIPGTLNLADILAGDTDTTSTEPYTAMLQNLIAKYAPATETTPGTTVSA